MKTRLMKYDQARRPLAEAESLHEIKDLDDKMAALKEYARRPNDQDLAIWTAEMLLRAKRKFGELSVQLEKGHKVGQGTKVQRPKAGKLKSETLGRKCRP